MSAHQSDQKESDKDERAENIKPELLRSYADIFEKRLVGLVSGTLTLSLPPEAYIAVYTAAVKALRFQADAMERGAEY